EVSAAAPAARRPYQRSSAPPTPSLLSICLLTPIARSAMIKRRAVRSVRTRARRLFRPVLAAAGALVCVAVWRAAPASASTGCRVRAVPAPATGGGNLMGVYCPAARICTAVGSFVDKATGVEQTLAERWSDGHWAIQPTPSPGGPDVEQLTAVSCLS